MIICEYPDYLIDMIFETHDINIWQTEKNDRKYLVGNFIFCSLKTNDKARLLRIQQWE